jgi:hypothetical protein
MKMGTLVTGVGDKVWTLFLYLLYFQFPVLNDILPFAADINKLLVLLFIKSTVDYDLLCLNYFLGILLIFYSYCFSCGIVSNLIRPVVLTISLALW